MELIEGQHYISGCYLENLSPTNGYKYTVNMKESVFLFPESIICPFVKFKENLTGKRKTMFISSDDYCEILYQAEESKPLEQ